MSGAGLDRRPARRTAAVAVAAALLPALVVGVFVAGPAGAVTGLVGALVVAGSVRWLADDRLDRRSAGSTAMVVGIVLLVAGYALAYGESGLWPFLLLTLGVLYVGVDAVDDRRDRDWRLERSLGWNIVPVLLGACLLAVAGLVVELAGPWLVHALLAVGTASPFFALVTMQVQALIALSLVSKAGDVLEDWVPPAESDGETLRDAVADSELTLSDVPRGYWVLLGVQFALALVSLAVPILNPLTGGVLGAVLSTGIMQGALWLVILFLGAVVLAEYVRLSAMLALGSDPGETLAVHAGGIVAVLLAAAAGGVLGVVHGLFGTLSISSSPPLTVFVAAPAAALLLVLVAGVILLGLVSATVEAGVRVDLFPAGDAGFAVGSALLVVAAVAASGSVPAVVAFAAVGGALLCWDLGAHASSVGRQLGRRATTERSEFVHLTASVLVLGGGVLAVTLLRYVAVPLLAPPETQIGARRALLALTATLVAVLALLTAVVIRDSAVGEGH